MEKICGIYKIENKINHHCYIGLSVDIYARWKEHKRRPFSPTAPDYDNLLYKAIRKYGIENFDFSILETCSKEELSKKEIFYIEKFNSYNKGYNMTTGGEMGNYDQSGEDHPNHKLTLEDVKDIRTRYNNHERKEKVYELYKDKINKTGFHKVWNFATWKKVMPEVYTEENRNFHKHNSGNKGSGNGRAKLTEQDVYNIRLRRKNGETLSEVYEDYKNLLTKGSFTNVWSYRNWKEIIV